MLLEDEDEDYFDAVRTKAKGKGTAQTAKGGVKSKVPPVKAAVRAVGKVSAPAPAGKGKGAAAVASKSKGIRG